ncbi:hypothetical protein JCM11641_004735 [Rhodosporidiobolus odoratus]
MGNNASSQAGTSTPSRSSRQSNHPTRSRNSSIVGERPTAGTRRKKSIDMPDVIAPPLRTTNSSVRRKTLERPPVVDEELDPDPPEDGAAVGSLRGALQGKAEHVVYGPRRDEDSAALSNLPTLPATVVKSKPVAMAIPGALAGGRPSARTPAGGAAGGRDGSLTNAGMGAIGASAMPMDPDDTTHPGFSTAPRLTSAVMMSTDTMPIVGSPKTEGFPEGSPFGSGNATPAKFQGAGLGSGSTAAGSFTPTQGTHGLAGELGATSKVPSGDLVATLSQGAKVDGAGLPDGVRAVVTPQTSFAGAASSIFAPSQSTSTAAFSPIPVSVPTSSLLPPHTASPSPPLTAPSDTVHAPAVPASALPLAPDHIPSGTSVIASPCASQGSTPTVPSPTVLLPPAVLNAPVAAIPIPLLAVPSQTIAQNLLAAAVDLGAGAEGVPTLIKWKGEDGQVEAAKAKDGKARGPREVFVTGTFAKGWKTKIELRKTDPSDFSCLISLPPGPHRLKFIVDNEWKASKHLPVATDADGNLINYLQVSPSPSLILPPSTSAPAATQVSTTPSKAQQHLSPFGPGGAQPGLGGLFWPFSVPGLSGNGLEDEDPNASGAAGGAGGGGADVWGEDDSSWSQEIPPELVQWGDWEAQRDQIEADFYAKYPGGPTSSTPYPELPPPPFSAAVPPPSLPAQLEKGPLNHAAYVTQGSGDDNSILPKPDHSVINHLAASPIKGGFLSVGVTTRYKRKFVTIVYYKALSTR